MHKKILFYISAVIAIYLLFLFSPNNDFLDNFKNKVLAKSPDCLSGCFSFTLKDVDTGRNIDYAYVELLSKEPFSWCWSAETPTDWLFKKSFDKEIIDCQLKPGGVLPATVSIKITKGGYQSQTTSIPTQGSTVYLSKNITTPTPTSNASPTPSPPTTSGDSPTAAQATPDITKNLSLDRVEDDSLTKKPYSDTKILGLTLSYQMQMVIMAALIIIILMGFGLYIIFRRK